ncbi:MAG: hypothetical protein ACYC4U_26410 [Pirellulaceae bacterium]
MSTRIEPPKCDLSRAEFEAIVAAANQGNSGALDRLREVLDDSPGLWQAVADLGGHCELLLINLIASSNMLLRESLLLQVANMREELTGSGQGALNEMAVQRLVIAWLQMNYVDAICPAPGSRAEIQRQEAAHRQFDRAVKALKAVSRGASDKVLPRPLRIVG